MTRRSLSLAALFAALPLMAADPRPPAPALATAPLRDWALQLRTDAGDPYLTIRGTEVRPISTVRFDITDLNMTVFSGDPAQRVDTSVLSPAAVYYPKQQRLAGPGEVRLIDFRDGLEATGQQWTYDYTAKEKKILIARDVRIVIHAPLPDMLK